MSVMHSQGVLQMLPSVCLLCESSLLMCHIRLVHTFIRIINQAIKKKVWLWEATEMDMEERLRVNSARRYK